jgi:hypothetical protein
VLASPGLPPAPKRLRGDPARVAVDGEELFASPCRAVAVAAAVAEGAVHVELGRWETGGPWPMVGGVTKLAQVAVRRADLLAELGSVRPVPVLRPRSRRERAARASHRAASARGRRGPPSRAPRRARSLRRSTRRRRPRARAPARRWGAVRTRRARPSPPQCAHRPGRPSAVASLGSLPWRSGVPSLAVDAPPRDRRGGHADDAPRAARLLRLRLFGLEADADEALRQAFGDGRVGWGDEAPPAVGTDDRGVGVVDVAP